MIVLAVFLISSGILLILYYNLYIKNMAKVGGCGFKIGYFLYSKTRIGHIFYRKEVAKAIRKYNNEPHSFPQPTRFNGLEILPIAISLDNYCYLVTDTTSNVSVLVDAADPGPIQRTLDQLKIVPSAILTTHKHWDHSDGNIELKKRFRNIRVYGGEVDRVPGCTHNMKDGDHFQIGNLSFRVYFTPGHTIGHVVYLLDGSPFGAPPQLFSGDHIFLAGIGRMFECEPEVMLESLDKVLELPEETMIWHGHEYAQVNLEFALHIDPNNEAVKTKLDWVKEMRKGRQTTSPSTLAEEKTFNPFLRTNNMQFMQSMGLVTEGEQLTECTRARCLKTIRERKDKFKYKL